MDCTTCKAAARLFSIWQVLFVMTNLTCALRKWSVGSWALEALMLLRIHFPAQLAARPANLCPITGTVCDNNFDLRAAQVACGQLGFARIGSTFRTTPSENTYGIPPAGIFMDGYQCTGE